MSESVRPVPPVQPVPPGPSAPASAPASPVQPVQIAGARAAPAGPSARHDGAGATEESVRRKLLMGAALLLALASIYAGVFNVGKVAQIVLAAGATMAVVLALTSSRRRNS